MYVYSKADFLRKLLMLGLFTCVVFTLGTIIMIFGKEFVENSVGKPHDLNILLIGKNVKNETTPLDIIGELT